MRVFGRAILTTLQTVVGVLLGNDPDGEHLPLRGPGGLQHIPDILEVPIKTVGRNRRGWSGSHLGRKPLQKEV